MYIYIYIYTHTHTLLNEQVTRHATPRRPLPSAPGGGEVLDLRNMISHHRIEYTML